MRFAISLVITLIALGGASACGSEERDDGRAVTAAVEEQVAYLEPESSLALALDLRYEAENWERLRPVISRVLSELRGAVGPEERLELPPNADAALAQLSAFAGLDFEDDVRPLLDGHLVLGMVVEPQAEGATGPPDTRATLVYRTSSGELRTVVEKLFEGAELRPLPGHEDVLVAEDGVALVGEDTLVAAESTELLTAAVERAGSGAGFAVERLRAAERGPGLDDPLLLATGDLDLALNFVTEDNLERARAEVPYLAAIERIDMALDVDEEGIEARARVVTTGSRLSEEELPLGPAGELELPHAEGAIAGGSRDQSRTTTFAAKVVDSMFAESDFVATVQRTERELGIRFEELLRQFDCPSVSVFEPSPDAPLGAAGRFSARSCVSDPERMRELLPKLAPRLPRILDAMRGLQGEGLLGLLLLAPDAPLSPGALLAQIGVQPLAGGEPEEQLYEVHGLRDAEPGEPVFPGPDSVVFGMIGDDFVVGSDRRAARDAARLETEPAATEAASALRVPPRTLAGLLGSEEVAEALGRAFSEIEIGFSAEPSLTEARARMPLAD